MAKVYELLMANPSVMEEIRKRPSQKKSASPKRLSTKIKEAAWRAERKAESDRIRALNKQRAEAMGGATEEPLYTVNGEMVSREMYMEHIARLGQTGGIDGAQGNTRKPGYLPVIK